MLGFNQEWCPDYLAVSGPDRPPSKQMLEQMRQEERERRKAMRESRTSTQGSTGHNEESYWASMQRQVQERTEKLNIMGDTMNRLEESSSSFANDVSKFVQNQKRKAVFGGKSNTTMSYKTSADQEY